MKKYTTLVIITKKMFDLLWKHRSSFTVLLLILVTLLIRSYRIPERLEFLGDQGSTAVILYEAITSQKIPLVGPEVSIGLRPGPIFYYLILPFYLLSNFNPYSMVVPMIILAGLTVMLLWYSISKVTNRWVATGVTLVYAFSPVVDRQSVGIWNPSSIPFFTALLFLSLVQIFKDRKLYYYIFVGIALGASVQLHYTNVFNIVFVTLLSVIMLFLARKTKEVRKILKWQLIGLLCFIVILFPYIYYQWIHGFEDIKQLLLYILLPGDISSSISSTYTNGLWLGIELVRNVLPIRNTTGIIAGSVLLVITGFVFGKSWGKVASLWFVSGLIPIILYRGSLFEHYVYYVNLIPYILVSLLLFRLYRPNRKFFIMVLCILLIIWQRLYWGFSPIRYNNDIPRTKTITRRMTELAMDRDYSFTLLSSRSFSDYHYRYFLTMMGSSPRFIYDEDYPVLFLVCDSKECPSIDNIQQSNIVHVTCYDHHCKPLYPDKRLDGFRFVHSEDVLDAKILMFTK